MVSNGLNSKMHKHPLISKKKEHDLLCICDNIFMQNIDTVKAKVVNIVHVASVLACTPPAYVRRNKKTI